MQPSPISLSHFAKMMGPHGLYQHATLKEPNLAEGYCVDDNARAIIVLLEYIRQFPDHAEQATVFLTSCFSFIEDAQHAPGTYYNFRTANGTWLTHDVSEDMYARLARTYAYILSHDTNNERKGKTNQLLIDLIPTLTTLTAPRAQAETCIAVATLPSSFLQEHPELIAISENHIKSLLALWDKESSPAWPWFQDTMTYANAILPQSMLVSSEEKVEACLHPSAAFLIQATIQNNIFTPIGSVGWYPKGGTPSYDNQQAIEAGTMFDFLLAYKAKFPMNVSDTEVIAPYLWFFGKNTGNTMMADTHIGACLDGLFLDRVNPNYGAESMLAFLWAELLMRTAEETIQGAARNALKS